jgi:hypothetical protein
MCKLSNDPEEIQEFMSTCAATGGDDADECYELALQKAREMKWGKRASCKTLILIAAASESFRIISPVTSQKPSIVTRATIIIDSHASRGLLAD